MRLKNKRLGVGRGGFTVTNALTECLGITSDFAGGWVNVNGAVVEAAVGAGQWLTVGITVDGVGMGGRTNWQAGSNVATPISTSIRVPHGRHHIGLTAQCSVASAGCNGADLVVAETNA